MKMINLWLVSMLFAIVKAGPCDIYESGGTPCVCAHSTIRSLYDLYTGNLYQVQRQSDSSTLDIGVLSLGGVANATAQDDFCAQTSCNIMIIYDQSGNGNHLAVGTPGGANPAGNTPASATAESITVGGLKAYSVYINPGQGYFFDGSNNGIPTGAQPGGIYMVTDGTHTNNGCCFDYGNGEANHDDNGNAHMNAINFGTICPNNAGCDNQSGPWVMADLENGIFGGTEGHQWSSNQTSFSNRFVTAIEKNDGVSQWALRGGNAQEGGLTTVWEGPLPDGYSPMLTEGGVILGTGGDDSSWGQGTFYEGAMTQGYPSDETEDAVQQDIVSAGYNTM